MNFEMKVLVIDDMPTMVKIISRMLQNIGFKNIKTAKDGKEAWQMLQEATERKDPYQFIVSDWNMPNMTGLELLKLVRASTDYAKTPFLMITAESEKEQVVVAISAGVTNYIAKPFTPPTLEEKIRKIFKF
ncbi:MAG: histidine kinase [Bdellovibrionales bacterium RIFOXYB1_FULL_37_110]|nr:MAG: histidine kinase [Bdellovibrionales bacterium RIFOXYC1_FULL_37_79]OFZ57418.1 MAG: histidine kinase [Bdellovibrionales bacterium RIFOXYB1_FULL_37_110]OFZ62270.1 MAG: histidine kinase [Bdellovibrionales bacterium RIFOXYD1_FULL_36_51]